jgi:Putative restriction endonuclease
MLMSTTADWLDVDDEVDPDTLKVPENPEHRRIVDAIGVVAARHLQPGVVVYRDMNWYPPDKGNAIAPDLMTLPAGVLPKDAKSYRQSTEALPMPGVVVEVPSASDSYDGMRVKAARYNALGIDLYVISTDPVVGGATQYRAGSKETTLWTGRPIASLGGLSIEMSEGRVAVRTPDGTLIATDVDLCNHMARAEADALARAAEAQRQTAEVLERNAQLEAKLRELGVEP